MLSLWQKMKGIWWDFWKMDENTSMSCVYFPSGGCTKCPPTPWELEIYRHTPEGIVEKILNEQEKL